MPYKINPRSGARLDRTHPLGQGLAACFLLNEGGGLKPQNIAGPQAPTTVNGAPIYTVGARGVGLQFVSLKSISTGLVIGTVAPTAGSVSLWAYHNSLFNSGVAYALSGDTSAGLQLLHYSDNQIYFGFYNGGGGSRFSVVATAANWPFKQWTHYCITWASATGTAGYVNGVLVGTQGVGNLASTQPLLIGQGDTGYYDGTINNFRFYKRTLKASEVRQLFFQPFAGITNLRKWPLINSGVAHRRTLGARTGSRSS